MAQQITVGIDIGTYQVKVMIGEKRLDKESPLPYIIGIGMAESRGLRYGYIINKNDIAKSIREALKQAEKSAKLKVKKAYLSIGGVGLESMEATGSVITSRADSEISEMDIEKAVESAKEILSSDGSLLNKKIIHTIPLCYRIDGKEILGRPEGMKGGRLEADVLFVVGMEQHLNDLVDAVEEADVLVEDIIASPIASSLAILSKKQKIAGCVLANIGAETVSIIVYENNLPISVKIFPIGGSDITNDIALGLQIPLDEAEKVKMGGVTTASFPKKKLDEIIVARLSDIFELIENHLKKIGKNGLLPAGIIITGGGSGVHTIEDLAKASLKIPSQSGNLKTLNNFKGSVKDATWSVAYGLCIAGFSDGEEEESIGLNKIKKSGLNIASWFKQFLP